MSTHEHLRTSLIFPTSPADICQQVWKPAGIPGLLGHPLVAHTPVKTVAEPSTDVGYWSIEATSAAAGSKLERRTMYQYRREKNDSEVGELDCPYFAEIRDLRSYRCVGVVDDFVVERQAG